MDKVEEGGKMEKERESEGEKDEGGNGLKGRHVQTC